MNRRIAGFTLIELMVVVSIIGLLAAIVLSTLSASKRKALDSRLMSDIQQLRVSMETAYVNGNYNAALSPLLGGYLIPATGDLRTLYRDLYTYGQDLCNGYALGATIAVSSAGSACLIIISNGTVANSVWTSPVTYYAIYVKMSSGKYVCMDSANNSRVNLTPSQSNFGSTCANN